MLYLCEQNEAKLKTLRQEIGVEDMAENPLTKEKN